MKNYSEMSDFEINCELLAVIEPDVAHMQLSADQKSFYHCGCDGNGFYETVIPDYCNSWADAGPIIEKNELGIVKVPNGWCATHDADEHCGVYTVDKSPLRAAMIVFLMMQE